MTTEDQVLHQLMLSPDHLCSGERLATTLGIRRTSVWKAIQALQKKGVRIRSVPHQGYALEALPRHPLPEALRVLLENDWQEAEIDVIPTVVSTNSLLKERLEHVPDRAILVAQEQTGGRGRYGRTFFSPRGGLYLSLGFRVRQQEPPPNLLTMRAVLALHDAIRDVLQVETQIKWVNDLLYQGRKVAGILTEGIWNLETQRIGAIIVGIGLNLIPPQGGWPKEIAQRAGALFRNYPATLNQNTLIATIVNRFETLRAQRQEEILAQYRPLCATLGQTIRFESEGEWEEAMAVDILPDGRLCLEKEGRHFLLSQPPR